MQIVIEISESDKENIDSGFRDVFTMKNLIKAVQQGIALPKGHGNLVDRKMVHKAVMDELWGTGNVIKTLLVVDSEFYVETIIPADKGDEE